MPLCSDALTSAGTADLAQMQSVVVDSVRSQHSKRAYGKAINQFVGWWQRTGRMPLNKSVVQRYRVELEQRGLAPATINVRLSAIRKLVAEAADNGLLSREVAIGIAGVKGARIAGVRTGQWLTRDQAELLLSLPDPSTNRGKRDHVILGLLIGCGIRRNELAQLTFEHVQQREGRWVVADLIGKGGRMRTVPMPNWAKCLLDRWAQVLGVTQGPIARRVNKRDVVAAAGMTPESICRIVKHYSALAGVHAAPHDLRRTFAKLAHRGRAPIEQIQLSLGHSSVSTTERYLGVRQDLADAPCDRLGLNPLQE